MRKDVQVSVLGILDAGGGPEAILTRTTGICSPQGGGYQVSYRELDEHGNVTDNLLFLSQTEIRIDRSGSISGSFRFIPGERTRGPLPHGPLGTSVSWRRQRAAPWRQKEAAWRHGWNTGCTKAGACSHKTSCPSA